MPLVDLLRQHFPERLPIYMENDAKRSRPGRVCCGRRTGKHSPWWPLRWAPVLAAARYSTASSIPASTMPGWKWGILCWSMAGGCYLRPQGCFETYCSATALIRRTRESMEQNPDSLLWKLAEGDLSKGQRAHSL